MSRSVRHLLAAAFTLVTFTSSSAGQLVDGLRTPNGWWFEAGYTALWTNGDTLPPLVTTNDSIPPRSQAGVLGQGDTRVILGGNDVNDGWRSGVNLATGAWLDTAQEWGVRLSWLYLGDPSDTLAHQFYSPGNPVLARPFINAGTGQQDAQLVAYPDIVEGTVSANGTGDLQTVEAVVLANLRRGDLGRIDLLGGYRYLRFQEGLFIEEHLVSRDPGGTVEIGTMIDVYDQFATANHFHGAQIGLVTTLDRDWVTFDVATKLGLGNVRRSVRVAGMTHVETPDGDESTSPGGLLALPSNIGHYQDDAFGLLPELDLKARVWLTDRLSLDLGYQLLFLTNVYRVGRQVDTTIDASQLSHILPINNANGGDLTQPTVRQDSSTLRAQGLTVGFTFTY